MAAASLETHVALLRGINVGGKNRLPMRDLVALFEEAGARDVQTCIQSGNVVFRAPPGAATGIAAAVSKAIATRLGLRVPVVTRTASQFEEIAKSNPFARPGVEPRTLHVGFLADTPETSRAASLDPNRSPPDELVLHGRELYLRCPNGVARTRFTNDYFDRTLATMTTMRNWRTVLKLVEMARAATQLPVPDESFAGLVSGPQGR